MSLLARAIAGFLLWLLAAGVLYALGVAHHSPADGLAMVVVVLLVGPLLLTAWFVRAYRRLDPTVRFVANAPGMAVLVALLVLGGVLLTARAPLAFALDTMADRHPPLARPLRALATAVRPATVPSVLPATTAPSSVASPPTTAPATSVPALPATSAEPVPAPSPPPTATRPPDVEPLPPPPLPPPSSPSPPESAALTVSPCGDLSIFKLSALPVRRGVPDRIWVQCLGARGALLEVRPDGVVNLRILVELSPPKDPKYSGYVGEAFSVDLDQDGASDLVVGYHHGDSLVREGGVLWARGLPEGRLAPLQRIVAISASAFAVGDLDGQPGSEIVIAEYGNPYDKQHPQGRLLVYQRLGTRWQQASAMLIAQEPEDLWLSDADGDGRLDALVDHDLPGVPSQVLVYPGRGLSFAKADPDRHPARRSRSDRLADLDGDGESNDPVALVHSRPAGVSLQRQRPLRGPMLTETQTLTYPPAP